MSDNAVLVFIIDSDPAKRGADQVVRSLGGVQTSAQKSTGEVGKLNKEFQRSLPIIDKLKQAFAGLTLALAIKKIADYSDEWKQLTGRLTIVTRNMTEMAGVQAKLYDIAQKNRQGLTGIVQLYTRLSQSLGSNIALQRQAISVTEAFAKGLAITGESAAAAQGAIVQFSQGIATGFKAGGQELNSLIEQAPRVARALAEGLNEIGVTSNATVGQLKKLGQEGVLNVNNVFDALLSQLPKLTSEYEKMPRTIGQAFTQLNTAMLRFFGQNEAVIRGSNVFAMAIGEVANNFDLLARALTAGALLYATVAIPRVWAFITALYAQQAATLAAAASINVMGLGIATWSPKIGAMTVLVRGLSVALKALPLVLLITALTGIITGTGQAMEAQTRYNTSLGDFATKLGLARSANKERRDALIADTRQILKAHLSELQSLNNLQLAYNKRARSSLGRAGLFGQSLAAKALNPLLPKGSEITDPKEAMQQRRELQQIVEQMQQDLADFDEGLDTAAGGAAELTDELEKLLEKRKEFKEDLSFEIPQLEALYAANIQGTEAYEAMSDAIERQNALRTLKLDLASPEGVALDAEMQKQQKLKHLIDDQNKARDDAVQSAKDDAKRTKEALMKPFENALEGIQTSFSNFFESLYSGGINSFSDLAQGVKAIFIKLAAELTTLQFFGAQGMSGMLMGGTPGSGSGAGGGMGGFGNLLSMGSSAMNLLKGGTSVMAARALDTIGYNVAGIGTKIAAPLSGVGPHGIQGGLSQSSTFTNGSFGGSLGAAAGGFVGNWGANKIFGSDRGIGADIGGTIGAIAGSFIPVPILGTMVGAFVGNAIGGLFGGKPSDKTQTGRVNLSSGLLESRSGLTGDKFSQENQDAVTMFSQVAGTLAKLTGGIEDSLNIVVGNREGLRLQFGEGAEASYGSDVGAFMKALVTGITDRAPEVSDSLSTAIEHIDWSTASEDLQGVLDDLNFAAAYDSINLGEQQVSQYQSAMDALEQQFEDARETVNRLGLDESKLDEARKKALKTIREEYNASINQQIYAITDPSKNALGSIDSSYKQNVLDAVATGGDPFLADKLKYLQLQALYADYQSQQIQNTVDLKQADLDNYEAQMNAASDTLDLWKTFSRDVTQFKDDLLLDTSTTTLGSGERRNEAFKQLNDTLALAATGDQDAIGRVEDVSRQFLEASKDYYSTTEGYNADFLYLQTALTGMVDTADTQATLAQRAYNTALDQVSLLQQQITLMQQMVAKLGGTTATTPVAEPTAPVTFDYAAGFSDSTNTKLLQAYFGFTGSAGKGRGADYLIQNPQYIAEYISRRKQFAGQENFTFDPATQAKWLVDQGYFNETKYLAAYPDVARAIAAGSFTSAAQHYSLYGYKEKRKAFAFKEGGDFRGGVRMVGEGGPELERTGPARYMSFEQTRRLVQGIDERPIVGGLEQIVLTLQDIYQRQAQQENANRAEMEQMREVLVAIRNTAERANHAEPR